MTSEILPLKAIKADNATESAIESTYGKKIIKPIKRYEMQLEKHELDGYFIKRMDVRRLKFKFDDLRDSGKTINTLCRVIRSSKKTTKLEINNSEYCELTNRDKSSISKSLKRLNSLQDVHLNFGGYDAPEGDEPKLQPLCHGLKALTGLRNMNLNFDL